MKVSVECARGPFGESGIVTSISRHGRRSMHGLCGRRIARMVSALKVDTGLSEAVVKVDDSKPGIGEGLYAGTWAIGLVKRGYEVGLKLEENNDLEPQRLKRKLAFARDGLVESGAPHVVDGITGILPIIDDINARLAQGERP